MFTYAPYNKQMFQNRYFALEILQYFFIYLTEHSHTDYHRLIPHLSNSQPTTLRIHYPHILHLSCMEDITYKHRLQAGQRDITALY